jgi:hypothetical protein
MFVKKVLQLVKPFLANLHSTSSNKYSYTYLLNDPNIFLVLFWHMSIQNTQNFTLISNLWKNWKKATQKKFFAKYFCKLVV